MSDLPPLPPTAQVDLRKHAALNSAAATGPSPPLSTTSTLLDPDAPIPAPWAAYFDEQRIVSCPSRRAQFHIYIAGSTGPVVMCLHGGGYTGLSWALVAQHLKATCRVVALDLRGHGHTESDDDSDLSAGNLAADVVAVWDALYANKDVVREGRAPEEPLPPTVLVGHSMGGAVAVHAAASAGIPSLAGLVVIDVVEGTALSSLPHMASILRSRPPFFPTLQAAVHWSLTSGTCRNAEAARVSLPSQLVYTASGGLSPRGQRQDSGGRRPSTPTNPGIAGSTSLEAIAETEEGPSFGGGGGSAGAPSGQAEVSTGNESVPAASVQGAWRWRTPLEQSQPHWEGWFRGLSAMFLGVAVPKVLILAGTDRLDKGLMVGQMQGKFQLVVLPQAGHAVHEDEAQKTAETIGNFIKRFSIGASA